MARLPNRDQREIIMDWQSCQPVPGHNASSLLAILMGRGIYSTHGASAHSLFTLPYRTSQRRTPCAFLPGGLEDLPRERAAIAGHDCVYKLIYTCGFSPLDTYGALTRQKSLILD